ncbi:hypothetical protein OIN82_01755 [Acinetobacter baumannii]|nr:hypothetical protein [Acinetobacter baumannii]MDC5630368.1 hypothetical protein [Acinetobacter baumannii]
MTDLNKEREAFEAWAKTASNGWASFTKYSDGGYATDKLNFAWAAWQEKAKAQAVPVTHTHSVTLTCAELKEAFDFGAPDGEKDQFQMETEMSIKWLDDGYDGAGYYCWYADLPEEGCIKLGGSESGAEG